MSIINKESNVQKRFLKSVERLYDAFCVKIMRCTVQGFPDAIVVVKNVTVYIEFKQKSKKPRLSQRVILRELKKRGQHVLVVDDVEIGLKNFKKILKKSVDILN